jgi:hypothetical protein
MTTTFSIPLHYQPVRIAEEVLSTLYTRTSDAIDQHNLINAYCNMYIEVNPKLTAFAEVRIDAITNAVNYYVASNTETSKRIPALSYNQALRQLRTLMVA